MRAFLILGGASIVIVAVRCLPVYLKPTPELVMMAFSSRGLDTGRTMTRFTRGLVPGGVACLVFGLVLLMYGIFQPGLGAGLALVAGLALTVVNAVVVAFTGHPQFQIPAVWRGKSEQELLEWLDTELAAADRARNLDSVVKSASLLPKRDNYGVTVRFDGNPQVDFEARRRTCRYRDRD